MEKDNASAAPNDDPISTVLHLYDPPLWLVTAAAQPERGGCVATFVVRASIVRELPRMVVGIAKHHFTWRLIQSSGAFALHLLRADDLEAVWRFGLQSGHRTDKLAGLPERSTPLGSPLYTEAAAWLDCRVEQRFDIGDRTAYLAAVEGAEVKTQRPVLSVAALFEKAPRERRTELDRLYAQDQITDAEAILAWRRAHAEQSD